VDTVLGIGADEVVDYKASPYPIQLRQLCQNEGGQNEGGQHEEKLFFDVIFDFVGGPEPEKCKEMLKRGGKFITAVGPTSRVGDRVLTCTEWHGWCCGMTMRMCWGSCPCAKHGYEMAGGMPPLKPEPFYDVVVDGGVRANVAMEIPFVEDKLREGLERVASRHPGGKVVINMEMER
jgi:NADPH:quinone reductase-like Zn-dependent oxidoreductase